MKYVLTHVNIIDGYENHDILYDYNIYINDNRIVRITPAVYETFGFKVIDKTGYYCIPGLINMHAHLFGSGKPSSILGGGKLQQLVIKYAQTRKGREILDKIMMTNVKNALYSGCTTVRGMGDFFGSDIELRNKINNKEVIGPRLIVSGPAITVPTGHGDGTFAMTGSNEEELFEKTRINIRRDVDVIKICITGGVMDAKEKGEPGIVKMSLSQAKVICDEAHKRGLKVASHTESPEGVKIAIDAGVDTIEHGSLIDPDSIVKAKQQGTSIICTISPALPLAYLSPKLTKLNELCVYNSKIVLDNMINGAKTALEHNIPVGLGTDASCPFVTHYNMWREIVYAQKHLNLTNKKALSIATVTNAKILGMDKDIGSLEQGKIADIVLYKDNPLEDLTVLKNPDTVIASGQIYNKIKIRKNNKIEKHLDSLL